jgi:arabinofuranosyltransferase
MVPWALVCAFTSEIPLDKDDLGIERGRLNFILLSKNDHPVSLADYREMGWSIEADKLFGQIDKANKSDPDRALKGLYSTGASGTPTPAQFNPWVNAEAVAFRGAIGLLAYRGRERLHICDYHGLADPIAARLELSSVDKKGVWHSGRGKPGHEKRLRSEWCIARTVDSLNGKPPSASVQNVLTALGCGDLAWLQAAVTDPLTWRRFWRNVWLAPRLTRFRIPQDIVEARDKFCG